MLHFHRLSGGCLLLFGCQRCFIAWSLVHRGSVLRAELLPHPLGTQHAARGGERARTGCAPLRLVAVEPLVGLPFADDSCVVGSPLIDCATCLHQFPFCFCQRLQRSAALLAAESTWVLQTRADTEESMHHTAHSAAHEQHTHAVRRISMHASPFPSPATERAKSAAAPCIISSVADLSGRWHADASLVCSCSPLVSRSIPPSSFRHRPSTGLQQRVQREIPRGTERNRRAIACLGHRPFLQPFSLSLRCFRREPLVPPFVCALVEAYKPTLVRFARSFRETIVESLTHKLIKLISVLLNNKQVFTHSTHGNSK